MYLFLFRGKAIDFWGGQRDTNLDLAWGRIPLVPANLAKLRFICLCGFYVLSPFASFFMCKPGGEGAENGNMVTFLLKPFSDFNSNSFP